MFAVLFKVGKIYAFEGVIMEQKNKDFDLQKTKELAALMKAHNLVEIEIMHGDDKVLLKRAEGQIKTISEPVIEQQLEVIKSPTVGTFYAALGPDSEPYVKIGSKVTPQTTVCMIDVMRVMNKIKAEITGTIKEILAKTGQAVEYGQPLFKVKPE